MAENNQQAPESGASESTQQNQSSRPSEPANTQDTQRDTEPRIPKHRLDQEAAKRREAEAELARIRQEQEAQQEERQQKQGEYQELADKRQKKIQKLEQELKETKAEWTRERRMNIWSRAAQGVVKQNAIADAFSFLSEDDLSNIDDSDESAFRQLAQNLVEVRDYLAAEGVRGAGSGGSSRPVIVGENGAAKTGSSGKRQIFKQGRRPSWK